MLSINVNTKNAGPVTDMAEHHIIWLLLFYVRRMEG